MQSSYKISCAYAQEDRDQSIEEFVDSLPDIIPETGSVLCAQSNPAVARTIALLKGPRPRRARPAADPGVSVPVAVLVFRHTDGRTEPLFPAANDDVPVEINPKLPARVVFPDGEPSAEPAASVPAGMCKKGGASRSRRDSLSSMVFVGEYLTATGVFPLPKGVRPSVYTASRSHSRKLSKNLVYLEKRIRTAPTIPGTTAKKPPTWRDLDDHAQAVFAFVGLQDHGPVTGFTAHLSEAVNARAYSQEKPGPWLQKQLREQLDKVFGHPVDFLMNVEEIRAPITGRRRLHVHGLTSLDLRSRRKADKARAAMRAAFGTWDRSGKGNQIELKHEMDAGWASYCAKGARWATPFMRALMAAAGHMSLAPSFSGPVTMMTQGTTRLAKVAAERARQVVIETRTRPIAVPESLTAPETAKPAGEPLKRFLAVSVPIPWHQRITLRTPTFTRQARRDGVRLLVANWSTGPPGQLRLSGFFFALR